MSWNIRLMTRAGVISVHAGCKVTDQAASVLTLKVYDLFRDCIYTELPIDGVEVFCYQNRKTVLCWLCEGVEASCDINLITFYDNNADDLIMTPRDLAHHREVLVAKRNALNSRIETASKILEELS